MSATTLARPAATSRSAEPYAWPVPVNEPHPAVSAPGPAAPAPDLQDVLPLSAPPSPRAGHGRPRRTPSWLDDGPRPTPSHELPDPAALVTTVAATTLEVLTGCRPVSQLLRWTTPEVHAALSARAGTAARRRRPGTTVQRTSVVRVSTCSPRDGVVEAAAVVTVGTRVRAMALRLEGWDGRWRVTVLELR